MIKHEFVFSGIRDLPTFVMICYALKKKKKETSNIILLTLKGGIT